MADYGKTVKITITFDKVNGDWLWPQIDIEGADAFEDYETLTAGYELLAELLLRTAKHRRRPSLGTASRRRRDAVQAADQLNRARWVQLSLEQEL